MVFDRLAMHDVPCIFWVLTTHGVKRARYMLDKRQVHAHNRDAMAAIGEFPIQDIGSFQVSRVDTSERAGMVA